MENHELVLLETVKNIFTQTSVAIPPSGHQGTLETSE